MGSTHEFDERLKTVWRPGSARVGTDVFRDTSQGFERWLFLIHAVKRMCAALR